MVLSTNIKTTRKDASGAVRRASRKRMEDAMSRGFAESQERVPQDRGTLLQSGFPPEWDGDALRYGYRANHAAPMEYGTDPFWAPIQPLLEWAERVTGDRGFGWYVQAKIAEEGIDAQPYLEPSIPMVKGWLKSHDLGSYLDKEL